MLKHKSSAPGSPASPAPAPASPPAPAPAATPGATQTKPPTAAAAAAAAAATASGDTMFARILAYYPSFSDYSATRTQALRDLEASSGVWIICGTDTDCDSDVARLKTILANPNFTNAKKSFRGIFLFRGDYPSVSDGSGTLPAAIPLQNTAVSLDSLVSTRVEYTSVNMEEPSDEKLVQFLANQDDRSQAYLDAYTDFDYLINLRNTLKSDHQIVWNETGADFRKNVAAAKTLSAFVTADPTRQLDYVWLGADRTRKPIYVSTDDVTGIELDIAASESTDTVSANLQLLPVKGSAAATQMKTDHDTFATLATTFGTKEDIDVQCDAGVVNYTDCSAFLTHALTLKFQVLTHDEHQYHVMIITDATKTSYDTLSISTTESDATLTQDIEATASTGS